MDRKLVEKHLFEAREHVATGHRAILRQRELILDLERDGYDTGQAKRLLAAFEDLQKLHEADHDRLVKELNDLSPQDN